MKMYANYNVAKLEILEEVEKNGSVTSEDIAMLTGRTPENASVRLLSYYRNGLVSRERIRKAFNYTITEKGRARIIYLIEISQPNTL